MENMFYMFYMFICFMANGHLTSRPVVAVSRYARPRPAALCRAGVVHEVGAAQLEPALVPFAAHLLGLWAGTGMFSTGRPSGSEKGPEGSVAAKGAKKKEAKGTPKGRQAPTWLHMKPDLYTPDGSGPRETHHSIALPATSQLQTLVQGRVD